MDEVFRDVYPVFRRLTFRKKYYHNVVFVLGMLGHSVSGCAYKCTHTHTHKHTHLLYIQSSLVALKHLLCHAHPSLLPGGPGSGKGTHCARVVSEFNFAHLSTGDLLRGEVEKGSPLGREVEETMRQGKLVPSVSCLEEGMMLEFKQVESCLGALLKVL